MAPCHGTELVIPHPAVSDPRVREDNRWTRSGLLVGELSPVKLRNQHHATPFGFSGLFRLQDSLVH
jgi:hypothetical protein